MGEIPSIFDAASAEIDDAEDNELEKTRAELTDILSHPRSIGNIEQLVCDVCERVFKNISDDAARAIIITVVAMILGRTIWIPISFAGNQMVEAMSENAHPKKHMERALRGFVLDNAPSLIGEARMVQRDGIRVHNVGRSKSRVIGKLAELQLVGFIEKQREWVKILWQDGSGRSRTGWVRSKYLKRID